MAVPNSKSDDALLKNLVPLNTLSEEQLGVLLSRVSVEKAKKGQYLFREGDTDHQNIYLLHGTIALMSGQKEMDLVSSGTQTARFALAHQLPRKHSAKARTVVTYVRIDSRMLSDMLARSHSASYEVSDIEQPSSGDWMSLLLQSPVFQQIPPANLQRVMMRMEEVTVSAGDVVIRQGDEGDYFYLISKGECSVTRSPEAGHAPVELAKLRVGKGFGEEALISDKPRGSTVTMLTDGVLVRLNKQDFIQLVKQPLSRTVSYDQACDEVAGGALWLDVRTPEEYEAGHLPGAINLPFFSLRFQASSLTMDRPYMVYGAEVGQSATAAYLLTERGAEVFVVDMGWAELAQAAGVGEGNGQENPVNNVIDFNRDAEDAAGQAKRQVDDQRHEIDRLKRELAEAQAAYDEEVKQRHTEIKLLKQALEVAKEHSQGDAAKTQTNAALSQEAEQLRESLERAESQLGELQQKLEQTRSLGEGFRQQSRELQGQLQESQQRHESEEGRLKDEVTELRLQLESSGESERLLAGKERQLEQLRGELAALEESSERYRQQAADDLARLTAERFELESSLQKLQERQAAEQADEQRHAADLQQSLDEARAALEQESHRSDERLTEANGRVEQLQGELQSLQSELDRVNQRSGVVEEQVKGEKLLLQQQIDNLKQTLDQQETSQQSLQQEKVELEAQLQRTSNHGHELENQVQALEERRQSLERELESIRQSGSNAESQHNNAMASLRQDLEQSRQVVDELRQSKQQLEAALQQAQSEAQTQQLRLNEVLATASQQASDEQANLDAALAELNQALEAARDEARQQREKRVEMEALLEQEHQTAAFLQRSLKTAEEAVDVSDKQYTEAEQSRQALEAQLNELQKSLQQLRGEQGDLQQHLELSQQDKAQLEQELEQLRAASETERQQVSDNAAVLEQSQQEKAQLEQELERLRAASESERQQMSEKAAALEQADQQLDSLRSQLQQQQSEQEAERQSLQARLAEIETQTATQTGSLSADLEARQQEIDQLREALSQAQAANAAAADAGELEAARQALSQSEEQIATLKREIEGLREVQMEMSSQLSDDADTEIQQLRSALEAEEQKRRKAEQLAQKADFLRREREVQETAIEMLNDDLENLGKEKDVLAAERDKLVNQLRDIRAQYTDLVNENDQLHSEMSNFQGQASDSSLADDLLTQMEELRHKSDRYEQERDQAKSDAARMRREVGELRSVIETYVEQIQDVQAFGADEQVAALRTELDMVRRQAHEDLEQMRTQLYEAESRLTGADSRDVDYVADQQAFRQEMVSLQQALNEKDHLLRLSQNQCRSLEDAIEDRDKEVDQLKRKLELLLRKTGGLDEPSSRLGSRSASDSRREPADELGGDSEARKSGLGRLFRKK